MSERPLGVTILAILAIIGAILSIYNLIALTSFSALSYFPGMLYFIPIAIVLILLYLSVAYGFLKGLRWSWFLAVILAIIYIMFYVSAVILTSSWGFGGGFESLYLSSIIMLILYLAIYGIVLFYLTRAHVKTYFGLGQPGAVTSILKQSKNKISVIVIVLIAIAVILSWGFTPTGEARIISISHSPEKPQADDKITITAEIEGGSSPFSSLYSIGLGYQSYFVSRKGGGCSMKPVEAGSNKYACTIGPFEDGTEIWIRSGDIDIEDYIIQVGHVERSDISSLVITNVVKIPEEPTTESRSTEIKADVTSNFNISAVGMMYRIYSQETGSAGSGSMRLIEGDTYGARISYWPILTEGEKGYPSGTKVLYRIWAKDESGNTAVTPTHSFTIK